MTRTQPGEPGIHHELRGPPDAPVFCLLHCFGADHRYWDFHLSAFEGMRVLRLDTPGHGRSCRRPGAFTLESLARQVGELLDALRIGRVHLCGVSFGGQIAQTLALDRPDRVASLALVTSTCLYDDAQRTLWRARADQVERDGIEPVTAPLMQRWFTLNAAARGAPGFLYMKSAFREFSPASFAAAARAMSDLDTTDRLARIAVPALVIASPEDPGVPKPVSELMARLIPDCDLCWIEPSRHLASLEHPGRFNELMRRFVRKVAG